ncbi:MAG TPA: DUF2993 domain-containing protein [Actinomycetota bacterium]|nr:DUF2993 domain-containing protein [Actinomycetota bacterium]
MKWLVRGLAVLVVLLLLADFGARLLVENLAGRALASRRGFDGEVDVGFGGFPFLLHLKDRSFDTVTIEAEDVRSGGFSGAGVPDGVEVRVDSVRFEMRDVQVSGEVWGDDPDRKVTAAAGSGTAVIGQAALNRLVPEQYDVRLVLRENGVRVTGTVPGVPQAGEQTVEVPADQVRLEASDLVVAAPAPLGEVRIPIPVLAEGVVFESVGLGRGELDLTFAVRGLSISL